MDGPFDPERFIAESGLDAEDVLRLHWFLRDLVRRANAKPRAAKPKTGPRYPWENRRMKVIPKMSIIRVERALVREGTVKAAAASLGWSETYLRLCRKAAKVHDLAQPGWRKRAEQDAKRKAENA